MTVGVKIADYVLGMVAACVADTGISESAILRRAAVGRHTLRYLRAGKSATSATLDRILTAVAVEYSRAGALEATRRAAEHGND